MAAHRQGKFFEMANKLYANMSDQGPAKLEEWAKEIGLDVEKFKADQKDPAVIKQVDDDAKAGGALGVTGTPSLFINGRKLEGGREQKDFEAAVEAELAEIEKLTKDGASPAVALGKRMRATKEGENYVKFAVERKSAPALASKGDKKDESVHPIEVADDEPSKGPKDALVTIAECSDFQ